MRKQSTIVFSLIGTLLVFACAGTRPESAATAPAGRPVTPRAFGQIAGIQWHLTQMTLDNKPVSLVENSETTLACDAKGNVTGKASINRYSGNLKLLDDGEIIWNKAFIMTRMAGPPELMQQEALFTQALMKTSRMLLNDSKLTLNSQDNSTVLEFEQGKP
jgi:heat shock protein HslJ